ncbi:MAG TPA: C25 family cysteine peptidase, partial [Acidobacteriota bacterium]|nr:C25 family cysteine peptidase [Acidobacteriota bacterium]
DVSLVNFIRISYWHTYTADSNVLPFTAQGKQKVTVTGFTNGVLRVVDITNANAPQELIGTVQQQGANFALTVNVSQTGQRRLLAFASDRILAANIKPNEPSNWNRANVNGEITMIAHDEFLDSVSDLQSFRASQGRSVALVNIEDIYDEFNYGVESPWAVKDFLNRARTAWRQAPAFVLLAGDASADPRNYLGFGDFDFVPTKLVDTFQLETASDNWFVDFNGDDIPEMAIGRLPVRTVEEADLLVAKIIGYEQGPVAGWRNEVILAADDNELFDFEGATARVEALLPSNISVTEILLGQSDVGTAKNTLMNGINAGKLMVNYFGHGSVQIWAKERLLQLSDTATMTNSDRLPFFNIMTCLNGFFHDLNLDSLAEGLLKAENGGAVAVWASSGFTATEVQADLGRTLFESLFGNEPLTIGEATLRAKQSITNRDVLRTWVLFGDPVTKFQ